MNERIVINLLPNKENENSYWESEAPKFLQAPEHNPIGVDYGVTLKKEEARCFDSYEQAEKFIEERLTFAEWSFLREGGQLTCQPTKSY